MSGSWEVEVGRLARLARLDVPGAEVVALAGACEAITRDFSALATFAAALPEPGAEAAAGLREDVAVPASASEVEGILAAVPRVDAGSRLVIVPRGLP